MQLNYQRHKGVALKIHWAQQNKLAHQSVWKGMTFLSVLFRQVYKEKTSSTILERGGYLISSQHLQHCWFRLACTEISANELSHNLSWTQNYWRVTVKYICTCGKSPPLHKLCVTLTLVPLPMSDDDYGSDPNQNNIPGAERWQD